MDKVTTTNFDGVSRGGSSSSRRPSSCGVWRGGNTVGEWRQGQQESAFAKCLHGHSSAEVLDSFSPRCCFPRKAPQRASACVWANNAGEVKLGSEYAAAKPGRKQPVRSWVGRDHAGKGMPVWAFTHRQLLAEDPKIFLLFNGFASFPGFDGFRSGSSFTSSSMFVAGQALPSVPSPLRERHPYRLLPLSLFFEEAPAPLCYQSEAPP